jgi:2-polyprenyl-3-methyl-5-hydroxy-6-metoxy-1,4-benzoquinol methylase
MGDTLMPTSWNHQIPIICDQFEKFQPKTVLDIGVGRGKYGLLAREYSQVAERIDGVEGEPRYVNKRLKAIYDNLYIFDIREKLETLPRDYDLVLMIDVIEHLSKEDAYKVLDFFTESTILIATPDEELLQTIPEYPLENHISHWSMLDFKWYEPEQLVDPRGRALIVRIDP